MRITKNGMPLEHMSQRTLTRRSRKKFNRQMDYIRTKLKENAIYVCTTADIWTANNRRFLEVTAHWVSSHLNYEFDCKIKHQYL